MASPLEFRLATVADIAAMAEIRIAVTENVLSDPSRITCAMYEDYLQRLGRGWVCERDGEVVGFSFAAKADASIWALFVRPGFEGLGVGKGLLKLAVDWLFGLGNDAIQLGTVINTRADRFYELQGWKRCEMKDEVEVWYRIYKSHSG